MENTGRYIETDKQGNKIVRFDHNRKYTKEELEAQRKQFSKDASEGKQICITDLFCTHGL